LSGLFRNRALGRSEKIEPLWIKALWARKRSDIEMWGVDQNLNEMIGPFLAWKLRRIGSSCENDFRSHRMSEIIGTWKGSGGSGMEWRDIFLLIKRIKRHKKIVRTMNQYVSIC
jgi:hypothetical protein